MYFQCRNNSSELPNEVIPFIKAFPLMDNSVPQHLNMPIFIKNMLFYRLAIHQTIGKDNTKYSVLFLASGIFRLKI